MVKKCKGASKVGAKNKTEKQELANSSPSPNTEDVPCSEDNEKDTEDFSPLPTPANVSICDDKNKDGSEGELFHLIEDCDLDGALIYIRGIIPSFSAMPNILWRDPGIGRNCFHQASFHPDSTELLKLMLEVVSFPSDLPPDVVTLLESIWNINAEPLATRLDGLGLSALYLASVNNADSHETEWIKLLIREWPPALVQSSTFSFGGLPGAEDLPTYPFGGTVAKEARKRIEIDEYDPEDDGSSRPVVELLELSTIAYQNEDWDTLACLVNGNAVSLRQKSLG
jgi:hypothetical protein